MNYNENKLKQDSHNKDGNGTVLKRAEFIHASGFAKDANKLRFDDKFKRIQKQMSYNPARKKSVTHISLNFDPSEKDRLDNETLRKIADTYMEKIGFGNQPYLVYKHNDAGHPHIHIVSTIIKNNGDPINTHYIGENVSEPARKEIEQQFALVVADEKTVKESFRIPAIDAQKASYGKSETKRAITNVLDAVIDKFKYTSLAELNAVLKQYNVIAEYGNTKAKDPLKRGLLYSVTDPKGNRISSPVRSSSIYSKPGLKYLTEKYIKNEELRKQFRPRIKNAIAIALGKPSVIDLDTLQEALKRERIQIVPHYTKDGNVHGLTFIDFEKKCVFNGSDIEKKYSASNIMQMLKDQQQKQSKINQRVSASRGGATSISTRHRPVIPPPAPIAFKSDKTNVQPHAPGQPNRTAPSKRQKGVNEKAVQQYDPAAQPATETSLLGDIKNAERGYVPTEFKRKKKKKKRMHL